METVIWRFPCPNLLFVFAFPCDMDRMGFVRLPFAWRDSGTGGWRWTWTGMAGMGQGLLGTLRHDSV